MSEDWVDVSYNKGKKQQFINGKKIESKELIYESKNNRDNINTNNAPIIRRRKVSKYSNGKNTDKYNKETRKKKRDSDKPLRKVTTNMSKTIIGNRVANGWSQRDLAIKCNLPLQTIQKYERGGNVINVVELNKIRQTLKVIIRE